MGVPSTIGLTLLLLVAPQDGRTPVPSSQAQKTAEKLIHEIFKDDYSKTNPSDKAMLATKLAKQAAETKEDTAAHFVLLRDAKDLAAQSGDTRTLLAVTDDLVRDYDVAPVAFKLAAFSASVPNVRTSEDQLRLAKACLALANEAALAGEGESAQNAASTGASLARKAKDLSLIRKADQTVKEVSELREKIESVRKAKAVLATTPDDPASNEIIGEFWCFLREEWEKGLVFLVKGTDFKATAQMDLSNPGLPSDQVALADAWWESGDKRSGVMRDSIRKRGAHWYSGAFGQLTGLTKARVEMRLKEAPEKGTSGPLPGLITFTSPGQLLKFRTSGGTWKIEHGELLGTCPDHAQWATYATAFGSMTQVTVWVRIVPPSKSNFRYWVGDLHFIFNHEAGNRTELRVGTKMIVVDREFLVPGKEQEVTLRQDGAKVLLLIDGKKVWEAETVLSGTVSFQAAHGSTISIRQLQIVGVPDLSKQVIAETRPLP